jgi:radical SAM protein with 4Fe4S-binding SPASM domain
MICVEDWPVHLNNPITQPHYSPFPKHIGVEITGRCQLKCLHCFNDSGPEHSEELPLSIIERIFDDMQRWGLDRVRITGGEPTLHSQFEGVLSACSDRGIRIELNSHGIYSKTLIQQLLKAPIDKFIISLDGMRHSHETIRGKGTFDRSLDSCRILCAAQRPVVIAVHARRDNIDDIPRLGEIAAELDATLKVTPLRPVGRAMHMVPNAILDFTGYQEVTKRITHLRKRFPRLKVVADFDVFVPDAMSWGITDAGTSCGAGRTLVNIGYRGDVYPCAFFATPDGQFSAGNIQHQSLEEIWSHSPVFEPFRVHTKSSRCQQCDHFGTRCAGGCPAMSYFTTGRLDSLDPLCFTWRLSLPK